MICWHSRQAQVLNRAVMRILHNGKTSDFGCTLWTHLQVEEAAKRLHGGPHHGRPDVGRDVAHLRPNDAVRVLQRNTCIRLYVA
jgi:hypothetical protein